MTENKERTARVPGACLECNQAIEIIIDTCGIETVIRAEENRRRKAESELDKAEARIRELEEGINAKARELDHMGQIECELNAKIGELESKLKEAQDGRNDG